MSWKYAYKVKHSTWSHSNLKPWEKAVAQSQESLNKMARPEGQPLSAEDKRRTYLLSCARVRQDKIVEGEEARIRSLLSGDRDQSVAKSAESQTPNPADLGRVSANIEPAHRLTGTILVLATEATG